jgi:dethiobiotin synthetase
MVDVIQQLKVPAVVAARTGLGTINHTLLTVLAMRNAKINLRGVVMIGTDNPDNRRAIERYAKVPVIGFIPRLRTITPERLRTVFQQHFDSRAFV